MIRLLQLFVLLLTVAQSFAFETETDLFNSLHDKKYHLRIGNHYYITPHIAHEYSQNLTRVQEYSNARCFSLTLAPEPGPFSTWTLFQKTKRNLERGIQGGDQNAEVKCFYLKNNLSYNHNNGVYPYFFDGARRENNSVYLHPCQYSGFQIWDLNIKGLIRNSENEIIEIKANFYHPEDQLFLSHNDEGLHLSNLPTEVSLIPFTFLCQ